MEKQQTPLEKYLDEKYPIMTEQAWNQAFKNHKTYNRYLWSIETKRAIATEAYNLALQQPLPPTPELQQMLAEKFPIWPEKEYWQESPGSNYDLYKHSMDQKRKIATEFYLAGQSSLKQRAENECCGKFDTCYYCRHSESGFSPTPHLKQPIPTDEEIEAEAEKRYGEKTGGQYHAARQMDKARFIKGAKWMRDTFPLHDKAFPSPREVEWGKMEKDFYKFWINFTYETGVPLNDYSVFDWFRTHYMEYTKTK